MRFSVRGGPSNYYLWFGSYGTTLGVFLHPWISIDLGVDFDTVGLTEQDADGNLVRHVRTLPTAHLGAAIRSRRARVRPFGGVHVTATHYASSRVVRATGEEGVRPVWAPGLRFAGGVEFRVAPYVGIVVLTEAGVRFAPRVQELVVASWSIAQPTFRVAGGVAFEIPRPGPAR